MIGKLQQKLNIALLKDHISKKSHVDPFFREQNLILNMYLKIGKVRVRSTALYNTRQNTINAKNTEQRLHR